MIVITNSNLSPKIIDLFQRKCRHFLGKHFQIENQSSILYIKIFRNLYTIFMYKQNFSYSFVNTILSLIHQLWGETQVRGPHIVVWNHTLFIIIFL